MKYAGHQVRRVIGAWALAVLACSGCAITVEKFSPEEGDVARFDRMTALDAIKEVNEQLNQAQQSKLEFYAPEHYDLAAKALAQAREFLAANSPRDAVVRKVAMAEAVLNNGDTVAKSIKVALSPELEIKERLDAMNAPKVFGREYESLLERLTQVIRKVENGQSGEAKLSRENLVLDLQALEARTVIYNALHETEETINRVIYRGGEKLAPITFREASHVLKQADEYIRANLHKRSAIDQVSREALFAAKRALYVTEEVASLGGKVSQSLEQVVLDEEYRLFRVARAISAEDVRNHPLELQSELLAKNVKELAEKAQTQDILVNALRDALSNAHESASEIGALDTELRQLRRDRNMWQAKEALYEAQIGNLRTKLSEAETSATSLTATVAPPLNSDQTEPTVATNTEPEAPLQAEPSQATDATELVVEQTQSLETPTSPTDVTPPTLTTTETTEPAIAIEAGTSPTPSAAASSTTLPENPPVKSDSFAGNE